MSEDEKKNEGQCCCCKCWKTIFIAIALLAIGYAFGHCGAMRHRGCCMKGDGHGMKACWDRDGGEREGSWGNKACQGDKAYGEKKEYGEKKGWFGHKEGCTCPKCMKKAGGPADPNKTGCPMAGKDMGKDKK
jgi:hypothetical protein